MRTDDCKTTDRNQYKERRRFPLSEFIMTNKTEFSDIAYINFLSYFFLARSWCTFQVQTKQKYFLFLKHNISKSLFGPVNLKRRILIYLFEIWKMNQWRNNQPREK